MVTDKMQRELERLERELPELLKQREQITQDILRYEGGIITLRALLRVEDAVVAPIEGEIVETET